MVLTLTRRDIAQDTTLNVKLIVLMTYTNGQNCRPSWKAKTYQRTLCMLISSTLSSFTLACFCKRDFVNALSVHFVSRQSRWPLLKECMPFVAGIQRQSLSKFLLLANSANIITILVDVLWSRKEIESKCNFKIWFVPSILIMTGSQFSILLFWVICVII